jgi:hypothetical protein
VSTTRRGDEAPDPDKVVTVPQLPPTGCELVLTTPFSTQAAVAFPFRSTTIWGSVAFVAVTESVTGADQLIGWHTACEIAKTVKKKIQIFFMFTRQSELFCFYLKHVQ